DLVTCFLNKYNPPPKNAKRRQEISMFKQGQGEILYTAWEIYKSLQRQCSNHMINNALLMEVFYNGSGGQSQMVLDASSGG
ncbi:hypothetical protein, partial [Klebsiella pneumoniae]|uniref:hypothetical protein n=1 Tax=Klebsiella pneumoniae TaxID=573 RepID=UPI003C6DB231